MKCRLMESKFELQEQGDNREQWGWYRGISSYVFIKKYCIEV